VRDIVVYLITTDNMVLTSLFFTFYWVKTPLVPKLSLFCAQVHHFYISTFSTLELKISLGKLEINLQLFKPNK